ncbi:MAG TPA: UvrD-helicase domain-containing protein, partial [Segetibacter sp.]
DDLKPGWPRMVKCLGEKFRAYNFNSWDVEASKQAALAHISDFLSTNSGVSIESLLQSIEEQQDHFPIKTESFPAGDKESIEGLNKLSVLLKSGRRQLIRWEHFAQAGSKLTLTTARNSPWINNLVLDCRKYHESFEFFAEYQELTSLIYRVSFEMIESYQEYKQQRGLIDFSDQELLLLKMLEESEMVGQEIAASFKLIMVDEFQDSSPVKNHSHEVN